MGSRRGKREEKMQWTRSRRRERMTRGRRKKACVGRRETSMWSVQGNAWGRHDKE
jgi:hypothetical protein